MNFIKIEQLIGEHDLSVIEESGSKIVHFFKLNDLKNNNITYPCDINNIKQEKIDEVIELFNKRYERFINLLGEINYKNILFICDGENDYCPSTILNNTDYLFPREDYKLFDMIYKDNFKN